MQLTKEILKERKSGIGGSDCAPVLGKSKWNSPLDVYLDKIDPDAKQLEETPEMEWGHRHEPAVIKKYEELNNLTVEQPGKIFRNEKYPWLLANVDGIVNDNLILEAKTTKFYSDDWGEVGTDYIPDQYLLQVAHYCLVLNKSAADIAVLGATSDFRIYHYERTKILEEQIIELTHNFWHNNVLKQIPPDPTNIEDIEKLYKHADETKIIIADEQTSKYAYEHKQLKKQMSELKKQQEFFEFEIKKAMGDAAFLVEPDGTKLIDHKEIKANKFQQKKFSAANGDLYEQYCEPSSYRKFDNKIK